ncbi:MAG TPA: discoidin domain-containing protein, partial [Armatimonadota bacterium]|nr:discoidin domain-containing protein [Armatimonadota bacterium]
EGLLPSDRKPGDGGLGILEGFSAHVGYDGSQPLRQVIRNDCVGESAMGIAFGGDHSTASNLCDFICFNSLIQQGIRAEPTHPCFGLMSWGTTSYAWERAFYGDDNARALLGLIATSALLQSDRWDGSITRALLANLRTTGSLGFRGGRIDIPDLEANGWRHYHDRDLVNPWPHYESYLWACYLWAYRATGHGEFLTKAESAIRMTMAAYPDGWSWANGIAQERARMLLCLAWLVRLQDTPEHRAWLKTVADDLLKNQVACGALREELGEAGGQYGAVPSNEAYGTTETPLIQENGDPACDLLYTTNFAFLGLHEAVAATGDADLAEASDRLAEFLCRIQVRSEAHPELDGAWFRAFDFEKWEFWGSSADVGWGAWSIESGWTQGWITSVLAMRVRGTSLWDLSESVDLRDDLPAVQQLMAVNDGAPYVPVPSPVDHLAIGAACSVATPPDSRYPGVNGQLTDGETWPAWTHPKWLGWLGPDLEATVDLSEVKSITEAGGIFMRSSDIGIFFPTEIRISTSLDGDTFSAPALLAVDPHTPGDRVVESRELLVPLTGDARYIRVTAKNLATIPAWHQAAGISAWLFCDELIIR